MSTNTTETDEVRTPPAQLELFGFQPTPARVEVIPRSKKWRVSKAFTNLALSWCAIPVVALVPPHFPWALGAFGVGIFRFQSFFRQRFTLVSMRGACPKCGHEEAIEKPMRMGEPHRLVCPECHQTLLLSMDATGFEAAA